jgi:hypothetical protein
MKKSNLFMVLAFMVTFVLTAGAALAANEKPNIVVIMGDDIGMWNIGAYGNIISFAPDGDMLAGGLFGLKRWNIGQDK